MNRKKRRRNFRPEGVSLLKTKLPVYDNVELEEKIDRIIHNALDRRILKYKLIDDMTLAQISEKENVPYSTVRDHYYKQRKLLFAPGL